VRRHARALVRSVPDVPSLEYLPPVTTSPPPSGGWRTWVTALLDLVFPPFCPVCRAALGGGRRDPLCGECWTRIERVAPPWCRTCGMELGRFPDAPADALAAERRCGACRRVAPAFTYARSATRYGDVVREALHAFKFGGRRALAAPLGDLLAEVGATALPVGRPDLVVPVPLHPRRERERGFNQALLLARRLGRAWALPVRADVLGRPTATRPQTELDAPARRANVRSAFVLRRPELIAGRHEVLVDDIMTTGSTASACATCLREGGAATVGVLTVARAL
jgi:ComF family protein